MGLPNYQNCRCLKVGQRDRVRDLTVKDRYELFCRQFGLPLDSFRSGGGSNAEGTARVVSKEEAQQSLEISKDVFGPHFQYRTVIEFDWNYFIAVLESGPLAGYSFLFYWTHRIIWIGRSLEEGLDNVTQVFAGHRWEGDDPLFNKIEPGLHGLLEESCWLRGAYRTPEEIAMGTILLGEGRPEGDSVKGHLYSAAIWLLPPDHLRLLLEDFFDRVYHYRLYTRLRLDKSGMWTEWIGRYEAWADFVKNSLTHYLPPDSRIVMLTESSLVVILPNGTHSGAFLPREFPRTPAEIAQRILERRVLNG